MTGLMPDDQLSHPQNFDRQSPTPRQVQCARYPFLPLAQPGFQTNRVRPGIAIGLISSGMSHVNGSGTSFSSELSAMSQVISCPV